MHYPGPKTERDILIGLFAICMNEFLYEFYSKHIVLDDSSCASYRGMAQCIIFAGWKPNDHGIGLRFKPGKSMMNVNPKSSLDCLDHFVYQDHKQAKHL